MQDPARLLLGQRVHLRCPAGRPGSAASQGQRCVDGQDHEGGQQRVPPEQRHEPRRSGGDDHAVRMLRVHDAQRPDVVMAAQKASFDGRIAHAGKRNSSSQAFCRRSCAEIMAAVRETVGMPASTSVSAESGSTVARNPAFHALGRSRAGQRPSAVTSASCTRTTNPFPCLLPGRFDRHRPGLSAPGLIPETMESTVLDFKKVCEVRIHGQSDLTGGGLKAIVVNRDVLRNAGTQLALPYHGQRTIARPSARAALPT